MTSPAKPKRQLRFAATIWLASMIGALAITVTVLPQLSKEVVLPGPLWLIGLAGLLQNGLILALAVWAGVALAPPLGLRAPVFEAAATGRRVVPEFWSQALPGIITGVPAGLLLFVFTRFSPHEIAELAERFDPPLLARVLYGGITEEVLLRWGVMTGMTWLAWRFLQHRLDVVRPTHVRLAIVLSALVFGLGHLPAAHFLLGKVTPSILLWVIVANTSFGVLFGWLFWRRGLESAMVAHATTHLVSYLATLF